MNKKILFVTHECSGTGAPILFLNIINELKIRNIFTETDVYAIKDGSLLDRFKELGRFALHEKLPNDLSQLNGIAEQTYEVLYFNTVESVHLIPLFRNVGVITADTKIVCHVHELDGTIVKAGLECIQIIKENADVVICVSNAVKNNLIKYNINPEIMKVIRPFPIRDMDYIPFESKTKRDFTVLGCGEITVVKGVDIFLQVAKMVCKHSSEIKFNWVGSDTYKIRQYFEKDIELWGLANQIKFSGFHPNPITFFSDSHLFFLSSRQDSFPLVCIEAACSGLPILHFPAAGGIKELLSKQCSIHLDYLNVEDTANKILDLYHNPKSCAIISNAAFENVKNKCSKLDSIGEIMKVLNNV